MRPTGVRDRRLLSVVIAATLLVAAIGVTGGFPVLDGHDAGDDAEDQPRTTWHVRVQQDGDARVTITMRFSLATENETRAFRRLAREFEAGEAEVLSTTPFERAASLASEVTRRAMTIGAVERSARTRGDTGELVLSFRWTAFAQTPSDLLVVGGAFRTPSGTWLPGLDANQELILEFPPQYQPESLDWPIRDGAVYIRGPVTFEPGEPSATFTEARPELSIQNASLDAERVYVGESVTVRATVENAGGESGSIPLELVANGEVIETRNVVVDSGSTRTVEFVRAFEESGGVRVSVSGVNAGTVAVVRPTPTPTASTPTASTPTPTASTPTPTASTPTATPTASTPNTATPTATPTATTSPGTATPTTLPGTTRPPTLDTATRTPTVPDETPPGTTNGSDAPEGATIMPVLGVLSAFVLVGGLAYFVWRRDDDLSGGQDSSDGGDESPGGPVAGATATPDGSGATGEESPGEGSPAWSPGATTAGDGEDAPLLSDEERVLVLLRERDGRMKQRAIVDATDWSNAKVSQLLSGMAEDGKIRKLRMGRENLIALPEDVPEGAE